jgi:hypothetical protein
MEDYLALIETKMNYLRQLTEQSRQIPLCYSNADAHKDIRIRHINTMVSIDKILTLCKEDIAYQISRLERHIEEINDIKRKND